MRPIHPVLRRLAAACLAFALAPGPAAAAPPGLDNLEILKVGQTGNGSRPVVVPPVDRSAPEGPVGSILQVPRKPEKPPPAIDPSGVRWSNGSTIEALPGAGGSGERRYLIEHWRFLRTGKTEKCPLVLGSHRVLSRIAGADGCGIATPVYLAALGPGGGVKLPGLALLDCEFALLVERFLIDDASDAALLQLGERLVSVEISRSYACGPIAGESAGEALEHRLGRAIDIAAFHLDDGRVITVAESYGRKDEDGEFLEVVLDKACRHFSAVIGPSGQGDGADIHLDNRCEGPQCRERICR